MATKGKIELLAPSGSYQALRLAVQNGADAVYVGLKNFSARQKADNFSEEGLRTALGFCRVYGIKMYVALNISIKESELSAVADTLRMLSDLKVDGVIVADVGVVALAKEVAPTLTLHISTQAGVGDVKTARFFETMGAERVVLARETTLNEIELIQKSTKLETEVFAHGALCVSVSGACYLSAVQSGNSGNRGQCLQPCRKRMQFVFGSGQKERFWLSTADLCLAGRVDELKKRKITALKIEGRLRRPEYVGQAVLSYRKIIDNQSTKEQELSALLRAFNRGGFTEGLLYDDTLDLMSVRLASHIGEQVGRVKRTFLRGGYTYAEVQSTHPIVKGDGFKILRETKEVGGADVHVVETLSEGIYVIPVSNAVQKGDLLHLTHDQKNAQDLHDRRRKIPIHIGVVAKRNYPLFIRIEAEDVSVEYHSAYLVEQAENSPIRESDIEKTVTKLGDTEFSLGQFVVKMDDDIFVPLGKMNELRREALCKLREALTKQNTPKGSKKKNKAEKGVFQKPRGASRIVICEDFLSLAPHLESATGIVYQPKTFTKDGWRAFIDEVRKTSNATIYLSIPRIIRDEMLSLALTAIQMTKDKNVGVFANGFGGVQIARDAGVPYGGGQALNIWNTKSMDALFDADFLMISPELSQKEREPLLQKGGALFAKGYLPLMTLNHCPLYLVTGNSCKAGKCAYKEGSNLQYQDAKYPYPLKRNQFGHCMFTVYNSVLTDLGEKAEGENQIVVV